MTEKISIIVPIYNVEKYLERCLKSILNQTYKNLEIILIDDGSNDNSLCMCQDYAKIDDRIKVIHKKNGGVSSARNMGLDNATGELIGFVDPDDWIEPQMFEAMVTCKIQNNVELVNCDFLVESENEFMFHRHEKNVSYMKILENIQSINSMICESSFIQGQVWCKLFDEKYIRGIRFNEEIAIYEDLLFCVEYVERINTVACIMNQQLYHYSMHENNVTKSFGKKDITSIYALEHVLNKKLKLDLETIEYLNTKQVLYSSGYIMASKQSIVDDEKNIDFAKNMIKGKWKLVKNNKIITFKRRIRIMMAVKCPELYLVLKKILIIVKIK